MPGFNFRFNDILASIGLEQLKRLPERIKHLRKLYTEYEKGLKESEFDLIKVDLSIGEVPVYNEFLVRDRSQWIRKLQNLNIETRPFYPNISDARYLSKDNASYFNSVKYSKKGRYLPSGPNQEVKSALKCIQYIIGN